MITKIYRVKGTFVMGDEYHKFTKEFKATCESDVEEKIYERFRKLKNYGYWEDIQEKYLEKKNRYLSKQDKDHPSFVVFVETIKEVWDKAKK